MRGNKKHILRGIRENMNKYQEALDTLEYLATQYESTKTGEQWDEIAIKIQIAKNILQKLVDKVKPKMPIKHENYRGGYYRCPTCDTNLGVRSDIELYCEKCGQALDKWEEEK